MQSWVRWGLIWALGSGAFACGDDGAARPPAPSADAAASDASAIAIRRDAAPAPDTGVSAEICRGTIVPLGRDGLRRPTNLLAASSGESFEFAWRDDRDGADAVQVAELSRETSEPTLRATIGSAAGDVQLAEGGLLGWRDASGALLVRHLDAVDARVLAEEGELRSLRLRAHEDGWVAAWMRRREGRWIPQWRTIGQSELGPLQELGESGDAPHVAMESVGSALYLAFADRGTVRVLRVRSALQPGALFEANAEGNASGPLALAFAADGQGLVAFTALVEGVRHEVRATLLDTDGSPRKPEQVVSLPPLRGRDPAVVSYEGGFAVAFRAADRTGEAHVRVAFVHGSDGDVVAEHELASSGFTDGALGLGIAADGTLALGWATQDVRYVATDLFGARLRCVEGWLRCSVRRP